MATFGLGAEELAPKPRQRQFQFADTPLQLRARPSSPLVCRGRCERPWIWAKSTSSHRWACRRAIAQAPTSRFDALEQQAQPPDVEFPIALATPVADKAPALKTLGPQPDAGTVPVQALEIVTAG